MMAHRMQEVFVTPLVAFLQIVRRLGTPSLELSSSETAGSTAVERCPVWNGQTHGFILHHHGPSAAGPVAMIAPGMQGHRSVHTKTHWSLLIQVYSYTHILVTSADALLTPQAAVAELSRVATFRCEMR